ncbi:hypothetical protein A2U01_0106980, partial [Trifolium medium]|nr:hypothetical protein [Trifolium medium]
CKKEEIELGDLK